MYRDFLSTVPGPETISPMFRCVEWLVDNHRLVMVFLVMAFIASLVTMWGTIVFVLIYVLW